MNIAIDGPAGAGKSTIAKKVAAKLSYIYVDTGAMFRALAVFLTGRGIAAEEENAITEALREADVTIVYQDREQRVLVNGTDVTGSLREEAIGGMASAISVYPAVREKMKALQQDLAAKNDVVMDGRDIGTVILPHAEVKIYLTASVEERARRRYEQLREKGETPDLAAIEREIRERDHRDMTRPIAPLKQADDAIYIDSSDMSIEEVTNVILEAAEKAKA